MELQKKNNHTHSLYPVLLALKKATGRNSVWQVDGFWKVDDFKRKKKSLIVSMTNNNSDREREVQDVGDKDEDVMHEPLLDDIGVETLMNEDDFEFETGS